MAHLRSYKSFNLDEIEEIESRIFSPVITANENNLKCCPGSTNIPNINYNSRLGALYKQQLDSEEENAKIWEDVKKNILDVLHHKKHQADPMVVHLNEHYVENDDLDFFDDISVCGILDAPKLEISWTNPTHSLCKISHFVPNQRCSPIKTDSKSQPLIPIENTPECTRTRNDLCSRLFSICFCRNRKN